MVKRQNHVAKNVATQFDIKLYIQHRLHLKNHHKKNNKNINSKF